ALAAPRSVQQAMGARSPATDESRHMREISRVVPAGHGSEAGFPTISGGVFLSSKGKQFIKAAKRVPSPAPVPAPPHGKEGPGGMARVGREMFDMGKRGSAFGPSRTRRGSQPIFDVADA